MVNTKEFEKELSRITRLPVECREDSDRILCFHEGKEILEFQKDANDTKEY